MFSPVYSTNIFYKFSTVWAVEKTNFLLVQNSFFLSLPVEKEIIINIRK